MEYNNIIMRVSICTCTGAVVSHLAFIGNTESNIARMSFMEKCDAKKNPGNFACYLRKSLWLLGYSRFLLIGKSWKRVEITWKKVEIWWKRLEMCKKKLEFPGKGGNRFIQQPTFISNILSYANAIAKPQMDRDT